MYFSKLNFSIFASMFLVFSAWPSVQANNSTVDILQEKQMQIALRTIGHEVLLCSGDTQSRVLPIEQESNQYRISFSAPFTFDPDDMISIIERVRIETRLADGCIVEVKHVESGETVHSFLLGAAANPFFKPCQGRIIPEDHYYILLTLIDENRTANKEVYSKNFPQSQKASPYLIVPFLLLIGVTGYFINKKKLTSDTSHEVLIGNTRFDKIKMTLNFADQVIELSNKEAELLTMLHNSTNQPIERAVLLRSVWGDEGNYVGRTLDVFISKLRKKLEADNRVKITNIRGVGYKLIVEV